MADFEHLEEMVVGFYDREVLKFSDFEYTLKSGRKSPIYYNQRKITSFNPNSELDRKAQKRIRSLAVAAYADTLDKRVPDYDHIFGIPQSMTSLGGAVMEKTGESLLWGRIGKKEYGISEAIEGDFSAGQKVVALDDVITTATSKLETAALLESNGLDPTAFVVMFDREEGGEAAMHEAGQNLIAVTGLAHAMSMLKANGRIGYQEFDWMVEYRNGLRETGVI